MIRVNTSQWVLIFICTLMSPVVFAGFMGLADIRYQLYKDNQKNLTTEIRLLAEAGVPAAQILLADSLAESSNIASLKEASYWYQQSYQKGRGVTRSIMSLARLSGQYGWLLEDNRSFYHELDKHFLYFNNPQSVISGLEIFLIYAELFSRQQVEELILYHNAVCINDCQGLLYKAVSLAYFENINVAEPYFIEASKHSARGIRIYFDLLPEEGRFDRFTLFASKVKETIDSVDTPSKFAIANRLRILSDEFNQDVIYWLDKAMDGGLEDAYTVRAEYMLSYPLNFSYQETEKVIQQVSAIDSQKSSLLEASLHIVREWKKLQPIKAYNILSKLDLEGVMEATIGLGDLYSMGGLDQVDQLQAIDIYLRAAKQGSSLGYQKIANIYHSGRGIVNDKTKAFAYSKLASYLGNEASDIFLATLKEEMQPDELEMGEQAYQQYLKRFVVKEGANL